MPTARAIVIHPADNVATALEPIDAGSRVGLRCGDARVTVTVRSDVPRGHKFALKPVAAGEAVVKYGETVGRATDDIPEGCHVHVHNIESERGRGDRPREETQ